MPAVNRALMPNYVGSPLAGQHEPMQLEYWTYVDAGGIRRAGFSRYARSTVDIKDRLVYFRRCLHSKSLPAHLLSAEAQLTAYFAEDDARVKVRGQGAWAVTASAGAGSSSSAAPADAEVDGDAEAAAPLARASEAQPESEPAAEAAAAAEAEAEGDSGAEGGDDESAISRASSSAANSPASRAPAPQQFARLGSKRALTQMTTALQALPPSAAAAAAHARTVGR